MSDCDHIVAFHIGHEEVRASELLETVKDEGGEHFNWCCGGALYLRFCPDCGHELPTCKVQK